MQAVELAGDLTQVLRLEQIFGLQGPPPVESLDAAGSVVVITMGCNVVGAKRQEHLSFRFKVQDRVLLALKTPVQDGWRLQWLNACLRPDSYRE